MIASPCRADIEVAAIVATLGLVLAALIFLALIFIGSVI